MANTTNYNWETPDDTDLVKDGAAAIRTLGSSIDTTTKALNPSTTLGDIEYRSATANTNARLAIGTTGQILSVVAGVPAWVANDVGDITEVAAGTGISGGGTSGSVTITNSMATAIDAKGDLIGGTGADTFARLAVGANGTVLTADSAEATGLKWATPAGGGGKVLQVLSAVKTDTFSSTAGSGVYADITGLSVTVTPSASTSKIFIVVSSQISTQTGSNRAAVRLVRGSTAIDIGDAAGSRIQASSAVYSNISDSIESSALSFLDSPSTTSATTYKVQIAMLSTGTVFVNRSASDGDSTVTPRVASTITIMEIGA